MEPGTLTYIHVRTYGNTSVNSSSSCMGRKTRTIEEYTVSPLQCLRWHVDQPKLASDSCSRENLVSRRIKSGCEKYVRTWMNRYMYKKLYHLVLIEMVRVRNP